MDHLSSPVTERRKRPSGGLGQTTTRRTSSTRLETPSFQFERLVHPTESKVTCVAFAPLSSTLAVSHNDGSILFWSMAKKKTDKHGKEKRVQAHDGSCECIAWSPIEDVLVSCGSDKLIKIYNATGKLCDKLEGHSRRVTSVAFSSTGKLLVSGSADNTVMVWNLLSLECVHVMEGHKSAVLSVAFSFEDEFILSSYADPLCIVWEVSTGELKHRLEGHDQRVTSCSFAPHSNNIIATASLDCTMRVWEDGVEKKVYEDHVDDVNQVLFSHDGRYICSCSNDKVVNFYNMKTGSLHFKLRSVASITQLCFCPDSSVIAAVDSVGQLSLWATGNGELVTTERRHQHAITHVSFSARGTILVTGDTAGKVVVWFLARSNTQSHQREAPSNDGKCVIS
eukprot:m.56132 g.56132  ORF g.56132 m.56132 type:complete len:395 (+) comp11175_c0_seq1:108-1292(+)